VAERPMPNLSHHADHHRFEILPHFLVGDGRSSCSPKHGQAPHVVPPECDVRGLAFLGELGPSGAAALQVAWGSVPEDRSPRLSRPVSVFHYAGGDHSTLRASFSSDSPSLLRRLRVTGAV
jgi:hypothetical protein